MISSGYTGMDSGAAAEGFRICAANLYLWGGLIDGEPTALTASDEERAADFADAVATEIQPDIFCGEEVWSSDLDDLIARQLDQSGFPMPHQAAGPFALGPQEIVDGLDVLRPILNGYARRVAKENADRIIRQSFAEDNESLARSVDAATNATPLNVQERRQLRTVIASWSESTKLQMRAVFKALGVYALERMLREVILPKGYVFGSGLVARTRREHPIVDQRFVPHAATAGLEGLSRKGVLRTDVRLHGQRPIIVLTTHLIHGEAPRAVNTRMQQIDGIVAAVAAIQGPLILAGDMNVPGDSKEYDAMMGRLRVVGMIDAFRRVHPDATAEPGATYLPKNQLAQRSGHIGESVPARLDYVFYRKGEGIAPRGARVRDDVNHTRRPNRDNLAIISDHHPIQVDFEYD